MKKTVLLSLGAVIGLGLAVYGGTDASAASNELYRVYNPNSGEHFYTESASEKDGLVAAGWTDEGIGWNTPTSGDTVYRVYNSNAGDHHYTKSVDEYNWLAAQGWTKEGTSFYSSTTEEVAIYRAYNPNAVVGSHNFTKSSDEQNWLVQDNGWTNEGIAFYGVNPTTDPEDPSTDVDKAALQAAYDFASAYNTYDFASTSEWQAFSTALAHAKTVLDNVDADQDTVNAALALLSTADTSTKKDLRLALQAEAARELVETDYPAAAFEAYQTVIDKGVADLGNRNATTTAAEIEAAFEALDAAKYDKTGLQTLVDRIDEINPQEADFAGTGWANFTAAVEAAKEAVDVNNLENDQTMIVRIQRRLTDNYNALIYVKDVNTLKDYVAGLSTNEEDAVFGSAAKLEYFNELAPTLSGYDPTTAIDNAANEKIVSDWKQIFAGTLPATIAATPNEAILRTEEKRAEATALLDSLTGKPALVVEA